MIYLFSREKKEIKIKRADVLAQLKAICRLPANQNPSIHKEILSSLADEMFIL